MNLRAVYQNNLNEFNFDSDLLEDPLWVNVSATNHVDLPRMREGRHGGQFWAAFIPCSSQFKDALQMTLEQIDVIKRLVDKNPDSMTFVKSAAEIESAFNRVARFSKSAQKRLQTILVIPMGTNSWNLEEERARSNARLAKRVRSFITIANTIN